MTTLSILSIKSTTNYDMLKIIDGNRTINKTHVKKLMHSIQNENLLKYQPIVVNEKLEVIDGQHRLEAAKNLGIPIWYTVVEGLNLIDVQVLNENMKTWSLRDFAESYKKIGYKDYAVLLSFCDKYKLPFSVAVPLLSETEIRSGAGNNYSYPSIIRSGEFKLVNLKKAEQVADKIKEVGGLLPKSIWRSREFIRALLYAYKCGIKHDVLITRLKANKKDIPRGYDYRQYLFVLEDIYNYKAYENNRIYLVGKND